MNSLSMVGTFSKHPRAFGFEDDLSVYRANGAFLDLSDGKKYLDWVCGLGANILGYGRYNLGFYNSVTQQVTLGIGFSLPSYLEHQVAEQLCHVLGNNVPEWTPESISVRFAKTGSDATAMAVRLARAVTGKDNLCHSGYSGWHDSFICASPPAHGILMETKEHTKTFKFNDLESLYQWDNHALAAVMLEQGIEDPHENWYEGLRVFSNKNKALLIMDEVVTGLRYGLGGASGRYGVTPDLICLGKALGNGLPISAVVGRREYLEWFARTDPVFCSSTHWGEAVSLMAAKVVLNEFMDKTAVSYLWSVGSLLMDGMNEAGWKTIGHPPRSLTVFESEVERAFFIQGMRSRGILMNRPNFICLAHDTPCIRETIDAAKELREEWNRTPYEEAEKSLAEKMPHILFANR